VLRLHRQRRWELALLGASAIWGSTFVTVKDAVERTPPMLFLAFRFGIAAAAMAAVGGMRGLSRRDAAAGAVIGVALFAGYGFQTVGTQYTTASNTAFITGLFVVFTPLLAAVLLRRLPSRATTMAVVIATAGLYLLTARGGYRFRSGDLLVLGAAVAFAAHVLSISRLISGRSVFALAGVQFATASILAGLWSVAGERTLPPSDGGVWATIVLTGVFASALALSIQIAAQRVVPPTRTALILTGEPVFGAIFAYVLADERFSTRGYVGAALILVAILVAELLAPEREAA
jgi:drug/metabolite transporter (DMT)-like permease